MNMLLDRYGAWEYSLLALCIWREARGESYQGKLGVGWSIRNRVMTPKAWWGNDYEDVILKPWQYSSFNQNDPNSGKFPGNPKTDTAWSECMAVAETVYTEAAPDPTNGATHYHVASMDPKPTWALTAQFKVQLGNHLFYKST